MKKKKIKQKEKTVLLKPDGKTSVIYVADIWDLFERVFGVTRPKFKDGKLCK